MTRFRLHKNGNRVRYEHINGKNICITVSNDEWSKYGSQKISAYITYCIRQYKLGKSPEIKYGTVTYVDNIPDGTIHKCTECNKSYKTRSGYLKHIKNHHPVPVQSTEIIEPTNERTIAPITNITNNTQNININLPQIRNFNDENPKWLTPDLIMQVIQNIPMAIPRLIKEKHFNDKFPENQNIRLDNKRNIKKRLRVYDEGRWKIENRPDVEFRVIEQVYDVLREFIDMMREDADDADHDEIDEDLSPIDKRIAHITRRIRASEMRSMRVRRLLRDWEPFDDKIQGDYDKVVEPFKDRVDTFLLDNELRLEQLREKQALLMA